jgi:hypothetical protein
MPTLSLFGTVFNKVRATVKVTSSVLLPLRSKNKLQFRNLRGDQKTISAGKPYGRLTCLVPRGGLPFDPPEISDIVLYPIFGEILHPSLPCRGGETFLSVSQSGNYDCTIVALFSYIIRADAYLMLFVVWVNGGTNCWFTKQPQLTREYRIKMSHDIWFCDSSNSKDWILLINKTWFVLLHHLSQFWFH